MGFTYIQKIPSGEDVKNIVPMPESLKALKRERDESIRSILSGHSDLFLMIVGPCSADTPDAVIDYVKRLSKLQEKVKDKIFIVPRIYTNKPRTTGEGYKGILHQPNPNEAPDIYEGILTIRKMHIRAMEESGMTSADEMLYPENLVYVDDLLSYIAIGARSVENQQHRLVVSGIDVPVGMKNPTSGDISVMINSITAAQSQHNFLYQGYEVNTSGNPHAHAILRGSVNKHGRNLQNYHYEDLLFIIKMYQSKELKNPSIIVDCNHANSNKTFYEQPRIVAEILNSRRWNKDIEKIVKGVMIESYIEEGSQKVDENIYGKSITDACLGFDDTEKLVYYMAEHL